jgi:hypothetical protein
LRQPGSLALGPLGRTALGFSVLFFLRGFETRYPVALLEFGLRDGVSPDRVEVGGFSAFVGFVIHATLLHGSAGLGAWAG